VRSTVFTDNQGQFLFQGLPAAIYTLVVEGDRIRFETTTATTEVYPQGTVILNIVLKAVKGSKATKNGNSVSVAELDAAVPGKAKKEFEKASSAAAEGKSKDAIAHLRNAISIYPRYLMARNDLGAQLLDQGKLDEAADELRQALEIDPKAFNPNLNLGIVLVQQHKFAEAEIPLKAAVSLDASSAPARLYNGIALAGISANKEAERELKAALELGGNAFSLAYFHLGEVYLNLGEKSKAAGALKSYLREAPNGPKAAQARTLLSTIK
jgi:tetratricopeptide (TPR) repeat protein